MARLTSFGSRLPDAEPVSGGKGIERPSLTLTARCAWYYHAYLGKGDAALSRCIPLAVVRKSASSLSAPMGSLRRSPNPIDKGRACPL